LGAILLRKQAIKINEVSRLGVVWRVGPTVAQRKADTGVFVMDRQPTEQASHDCE
jgi:hypothetical protein